MFRIAVAAIAVIALIAAFTGVMYLRFWADETNRVLVHTQTGSEVVVAVRDIPAATKIEADMVSTRTLPDAEVARDAFTDTAKAIGQVTKFELSAGEQVTSLKVETPNVGVSYVR